MLLIAAVLSVGALEALQLSAGATAIDPPARFSELADWADHIVKNRLTQFPALRQLAPAMLLRGGAKEQDGIFITRDYLLENITPGDPAILEANLAGIEHFLDTRNLPAAFLLIPTAVAIKQQEVPAKAQLFNQKALISEVYDRLSGRATTVDVYPTLFAAKDQYTYYRTDSALTGLGGYYVYTSLAARLGVTPRALDQFEVEHLAHPYYGALYERSSYKGVGPDIVTIYSFSKNDRQYKLTHTAPTGIKSYYTLFPRHLEQLSG
ncbi:MAG: DHHW family protein, partial [Oscillospiraceae bacterium]